MYGSQAQSAHDGAIQTILAIFAVIKAVEDLLHHDRELPARGSNSRRSISRCHMFSARRKTVVTHVRRSVKCCRAYSLCTSAGVLDRLVSPAHGCFKRKDNAVESMSVGDV